VGFQKVKLFSKIEVHVAASAQGTFAILTDLPGNAMAQRTSFPIPTTTRRPVIARLPFNTQGHLIQALLTPNAAGTVTLYGARVWARELPNGEWAWYDLPVIETPAEYASAPLPIPSTPEEWSPAELPIPATPEAWNPSALPIPPTPEEWSAAELPIPPTPEAWGTAELPLKPTPVVPGWSDLEVDK
jgi:hypothetical protein